MDNSVKRPLTILLWMAVIGLSFAFLLVGGCVGVGYWTATVVREGGRREEARKERLKAEEAARREEEARHNARCWECDRTFLLPATLRDRVESCFKSTTCPRCGYADQSVQGCFQRYDMSMGRAFAQFGPEDPEWRRLHERFGPGGQPRPVIRGALD